MQLLKLTPVAFLFALAVPSCKTDLSDGLVQKFGLPMTKEQVIPTNGSSASGTINASYNKASHTLNYTVTWTGLTGNITAMHIHGPAYKGYFPIVAVPFQQNITGFINGKTGAFTSSVYIDEVAAKESELLHGQYYIDIHTSANSTYGEIRGQIEF